MIAGCWHIGQRSPRGAFGVEDIEIGHTATRRVAARPSAGNIDAIANHRYAACTAGPAHASHYGPRICLRVVSKRAPVNKGRCPANGAYDINAAVDGRDIAMICASLDR